MAWTAYIKLDDDKDDVGIAAVVWNQGQADEFRYQRRAEVTLAEANKIKAEAEVALLHRDDASVRETSLAGILQGVMNG